MLRTCLLLIATTLAACGGDSSPPDAAAGIDTAMSVDAPAGTPDAAGATCTGALYDSCTDNTQCTSNNCKTFNAAGITVCTQACSAQNPCPDQNGQAVMCNNMGICRPNTANACTL